MAEVFAIGQVIQIGACNPHVGHVQRSGASDGVCCVGMKRLQPQQGLLRLLTRPVAQARCSAEAT